MPRPEPLFDWPPLRSAVEGIDWPAIPGPHTAGLLGLLAQLEHSQWWSPERLIDHQERQLARLLTHAAAHSPWFRETLTQAGWSGCPERASGILPTLPRLDRRHIQTHFDAMISTRLPAYHGPTHKNVSSGSTGEPVQVLRSALCQQFWQAMTLRDHLWQRRDFSRSLAVIRSNYGPADGLSRTGWGAPVDLLFQSGLLHAMNIQSDLARQARWLSRVNPHYLLTYPSNLAGLLDHFANDETLRHALGNLCQIRCIAESIPDTLRQRARTVLDVDIADTYSCKEAGVIAIQCPSSSENLYHLMSESLIVEILDDAGQPCAPGQIGQVVITDLHNFAMPIIRYNLSDHAEAGPVCPCGRGLPTIRRILGRTRNLVRLPDGRCHWPCHTKTIHPLGPIRQIQMIQHTLDQIEVRLAIKRPLSSDELHRTGESIQAALGYPFALTFTCFDGALPNNRTGKFEEFICACPAEPA